MTLLFAHLAQSLRRPDHWIYGSWVDTLVKYRKTRLGAVWMLVPISVYVWGVGGFMATLQPGIDPKRYLAHVGVGFLLFRLISTVLTDATSVFASYQSYIYDGQLRLTDFVLRMLARSFYYFLLSLPIVAVVAVASPTFSIAGAPASLLGLLLVLVNLFLYGTLLGIAGARLPDLSELMGSAMMAVFLITPIVWYPEAAPEGTLQGALMRANPFHHLLAAARAPMLGEAIEPVTWVYLGVMTLMGLIAAACVYRVAARRVPLWL